MYRRTFGIIILIILTVCSLTAQSDRVAGKIRGKVIDGETGSPLVGADVIILPVSKGLGTATDANGQFVIANVPGGTYTIQAKYIGYSAQQLTDVEVFPGQTTNLTFELEVQAVKGEEVVVVAEAKKRVITVRTPSSQKEIRGEDIERMPVNDFTDVLANSSGAVETEGGRSQGIHIRGGRSGEVAFYVDGINTNDPVTHDVGIEIDNNAIEQIVISTGGFSAEYGEAMSGAVSIITKEGNVKRHSGNIEYEYDGLPAKFDSDLDYGFKKYRFSLSGPLPFLGGSFTYFVSGAYEDSREHEARVKHLNHFSTVLPSGVGKIVFSPRSSSFKAILQGSFNDEERYNYLHSISKGNWLNMYYKTNAGHRRLSLKLSDTFSAKSAWELQLYTFSTFRNFSSMEGTNYKDIKYLSTRLPWVYDAEQNGWYDTMTRKWKPIVDENGANKVKENWIAPDGTNLQTMSYEDQAYYYYYAQKQYYNPITGEWNSPSYQMEAMNARYHDPNYYYVPSYLPEESNWYDSNDSTVHHSIFDTDHYAKYLFMSRDDQGIYDLWGYNGDVHSGWYWDRDIYNVFTFGPGRPRYHDQNTSNYAAEFHSRTQYNNYNELKFGFKYQQSDLEYTDIQFANQNPYFDSYHYRPTVGAAWLENKFEYEDLIASLGVRYDYFHPHAQALWDPQNFDVGKDGVPDELETGYDPSTNPDPHGDNWDPELNPNGTEGDGNVDRKQSSAKNTFSPRLGISFAVSDMTAMFANYGHFYQIPEYGEIYQNLYTDLTSGLPLIGNPDMPLEHTIAYEVGLKHTVTDALGLELMLYYKDVVNLLATRTYNTIFNGRIATVTFQEMVDFAKIKGMDFKITMRDWYGVTGEISYSYLDAKGTGSSSREFYYLYIYEADRPLPAKEYPLEFDITHSFKANLNYMFPLGFGPGIGFFHPLQFINVNVFAIMNSGAPYTPENERGTPQELGSKRMPSTKRIDLRIEKFIPLLPFLRFSVFLDIRNLFDTRNVAYVYPYSGKPDTNGRPPLRSNENPNLIGQTDPYTGQVIRNLDQAYELHMRAWKELRNNPFNYGRARSIHFGISLSF